MSDLFEDLNSSVVSDMETRIMESISPYRVVEYIRQHTRIAPGNEKRWVTEMLPQVQQMCSCLVVRIGKGASFDISVGKPSLTPVLLSCSRGTSWFSSVDMQEAVAQGIVSKTERSS